MPRAQVKTEKRGSRAVRLEGMAKDLDIPGRSTMTRTELVRAQRR